MTFSEFDEMLTIMHQEEFKVGKTKGREYTLGEKEGAVDDRLDNFKRLGKSLGVPPKIVCVIYLMKHIDSILRFCETNKVLSEPIDGRITDARVYLSLLQGLIADERKVACETKAQISREIDSEMLDRLQSKPPATPHPSGGQARS